MVPWYSLPLRWVDSRDAALERLAPGPTTMLMAEGHSVGCGGNRAMRRHTNVSVVCRLVVYAMLPPPSEAGLGSNHDSESERRTGWAIPWDLCDHGRQVNHAVKVQCQRVAATLLLICDP
jgi:hypothetical protein